MAIRRRARRWITYAGCGLVALAAAFLFSSSLGSLAVILGFASAGIAFALQGVIANLAAWLVNSTGSYYKIGDRIQMGGVAGDVIDVNAMVTTLMEIGGWVKADLSTRDGMYACPIALCSRVPSTIIRQIFHLCGMRSRFPLSMVETANWRAQYLEARRK